MTFKAITQQYPCYKTVVDLISRFREIVLTNNAQALPKWIYDVRNTDISELISFTNGLERDYDAVMNAIQFPYSNGLAEGKINKLKVIKRIMYGRCKFETLRSKVLQLERINEIN